MPLYKLFGLEASTEPVAQAGKTLSCVSCGLFKETLSPKMDPYGECDKGIMLIGEGPGAEEDKNGRPFQGRSGNVLKTGMRELGIDMFRDCVCLNAVNCRPPSNRSPTPHEAACCRVQKVNPALEKYKPHLVILFGGSALVSLLGSLMPDIDERIGKWRNCAVPVPDWGCWVAATYHPSYVMREEKKPEVEVIWKSDIERALKLLERPRPKPEDLRKKVVILRTEEEILAALNRVSRRGGGLFSFDYETTGLKAILHGVVCASFAISADRAYAFMLDNASIRVVEAWHNILSDSRIGKISHNLRFEQEYSKEHFGVTSINWKWDSMLCAHILDNRPGICGLKVQAFLNFGVKPYDTVIGPYLKSIDDKDPRSPNRIYEFIDRYGQDECLVYCGIDSLITFRLAKKQMMEIQG